MFFSEIHYFSCLNFIHCSLLNFINFRFWTSSIVFFLIFYQLFFLKFYQLFFSEFHKCFWITASIVLLCPYNWATIRQAGSCARRTIVGEENGDAKSDRRARRGVPAAHVDAIIANDTGSEATRKERDREMRWHCGRCLKWRSQTISPFENYLSKIIHIH